LLAPGALDRLTHRAPFVKVMGPSFLAEQTKQRLAAGRRAPATLERSE